MQIYPGIKFTQSPLKHGENALKAKQWALVIDSRKFESEEDLEPLVEVCNKIHNVPHLSEKRHEIKWIWGVHFLETGHDARAQIYGERTRIVRLIRIQFVVFVKLKKKMSLQFHGHEQLSYFYGFLSQL